MHRYRTLAGICGGLLLSAATVGQAQSLLRPLGFPDPQPFRLDDALNGRDFEYNSESFLHRFTFRSLTPLSSGLAQDREGLYGTAGSTKSNELYTVMYLQKTLPLDDDYFLRYRFVRDEDFDGRYDRNLLGFGRNLGERWSFSFSGDVQGDKSRIDLETELSWRGEDGSHARFALVAPDALFNDKQREAQFTRHPYTGFIDLRWQVHTGVSLWMFANHNAPSRLRSEALDLDFSDRGTAAGLGADTVLGARWRLSAWLEGESSRRIRTSLSDVTDPVRFTRRYREAGAQLSRDVMPKLEGWTGIRLLRLDEDGRHTLEVLDQRQLSRDEVLVYAGVSWRLGSRYRFHPGVYLNRFDNDETFAHAPTRNRDEAGIEAKLALPLELNVHRASGATLTINPTLRLHRPAFGGGNIQAHIPF
ncbi:MAG: hypothetical protein ABR553_08000 [Gammaproteobacteria bacterium]